MSTASVPYSTTQQPRASVRSIGALARIFRKETKYEFLKLLRNKQFCLATIGFPVMFYTLFGLSNHKAIYGNFQLAKYLMGGYACFGLVGAALFGIGVGMAAEISAGWLEVKRASPMPPMAYLFAKCITAIAFGLIIVSILITLGASFGGVLDHGQRGRAHVGSLRGRLYRLRQHGASACAAGLAECCSRHR